MSDREKHLERIRTEFLDGLRAGRPFDREAVLAENPDLTDDLKALFENGQLMIDLGLLPPSPNWLRNARSEQLPDIEGFVVKCCLGKGGMGVVYLASEPELGRHVAIKMIRHQALDDEKYRRRFEKEALALGTLEHLRIVPIYKNGQSNGLCYFSMKYMPGGGLDQRLDKYTADPTKAARLVSEIAGAIQYAHNCDFLHRDLKPSNILFDDQDQAYVADFGLAKQIGSDSDLTLADEPVGTPGYMAPEQALDDVEGVSRQTDVYGLGAILYALLTGHAPFEGRSNQEVLTKLREEEPTPPTRRNTSASIPRDLEAICLKCLEKSPKDRYPTAEALADDLDRFLEGVPTEARPVGRPARAWKWCRRKLRKPAVKVAVAALVLAGLIGAGVVSNQHERERLHIEIVRKQLGSTEGRIRALLDAGDIAGAERVASEAEGLLRNEGEPLQREFGPAVADALMLARIWRVRHPTTPADWKHHTRRPVVAAKYAEAFLAYGIDVNDADRAVDRIKRSRIRDHLVVALDDRARATPNPKARESLWAIADRADPDPDGPLGMVRRAIRRRDPAELRKIARLEGVRALPPEILASLSVALRDINALPDAIDLLRETRRRNSGNFWVLLELQADLRLAAKTPEEQAEAGRIREVALEESGWSPLVDFLAGILEFDRARLTRERVHLEKSVAAYDETIRIDPRFAPAFCNRGNTLTELKREDEAIGSFHEAIKLDSNYARPHFNLGVLLEDRGDLEAAMSEYRETCRIDGGYAEAWINLGLLEYKLGRFKAAAADFERGSVELEPGDPARAFFRKRSEIARAISAVEPKGPDALVRKYNPTDASEVLLLARLLVHETRGKFGRAAELFDEALTRKPELAEEPLVDNAYDAGIAAGFATGPATNRGDIDRFRALALKWLRVSLAALERRAKTREISANAARDQARAWLRGEFFNQLQATGALDGLPAAERSDWIDLLTRLRRLAGR